MDKPWEESWSPALYKESNLPLAHYKPCPANIKLQYIMKKIRILLKRDGPLGQAEISLIFHIQYPELEEICFKKFNYLTKASSLKPTAAEIFFQPITRFNTIKLNVNNFNHNYMLHKALNKYNDVLMVGQK